MGKLANTSTTIKNFDAMISASPFDVALFECILTDAISYNCIVITKHPELTEKWILKAFDQNNNLPTTMAENNKQLIRVFEKFSARQLPEQELAHVLHWFDEKFNHVDESQKTKNRMNFLLTIKERLFKAHKSDPMPSKNNPLFAMLFDFAQTKPAAEQAPPKQHPRSKYSNS